MNQADTQDIQKQILMEAGTNEFEVLVFIINKQKYGINVAKVREVIRPPKMVKPPNSHPFVMGAFDLRGVVISAINVRAWLSSPEQVDKVKNRIIVTEFNGVWFGFWVDGVDRIHRVSWENIDPPPIEAGTGGYVTGVAHIDDKLVMMLDFEKVVFDISPNIKLTEPEFKLESELNRQDYNILFSEDSTFIRELVQDNLQKAGYGSITTGMHGQEALNININLNANFYFTNR